jgi:hypothetical protein
MTNDEAKDILKEMRPNKPRKVENKRKQQALDIAISTIDNYKNLLKLITTDKRFIK